MGEDLVGRRFGCLTVTGDNGKPSWNGRKWVCTCDCGEVSIFGVKTLSYAGSSFSCTQGHSKLHYAKKVLTVPAYSYYPIDGSRETPPESKYGMFERRRRRGSWKPVNFDHPNGASGPFNLVAICRECRRTMHDVFTEHARYARKTYPFAVGRRRSNDWSKYSFPRGRTVERRLSPSVDAIDNRRVCDDCAYVKWSEVRRCSLCGIFGSARKVQGRSHVYRWKAQSDDDSWGPDDDVLCTGCWNRVRALVDRANEADEIRRLAAKLERAIKHGNENKRQAAGTASSGDR